MTFFEGVGKLVRRRVFVVVGVFVVVALSVGAGVVLAGASSGGINVQVNGPLPREPIALNAGPGKKVIVGHSLKNDISPALRTIPAKPLGGHMEMEASPNPRAVSIHKDAIDAVRQNQQFSPNMPAATLNFDGILFPGVGCNCAPPDTNGEVGADAVRADGQRGLPGLQQDHGRFRPRPGRRSRRSGAASAASARLNGDGDPVVLYDQLANRWVDHASSPARACRPTSASPSRRRATQPARGTATTSTSASQLLRLPAARRSGRTPTT